MLLPKEHGELIPIKDINRRYPSLVQSMQMAAFFNDEKGLLVIGNDPQGDPQDWKITGNTLTIDYLVAECEPILIEIEPTIEAAAAEYKKWAKKQYWWQWRNRFDLDLSFISTLSSNVASFDQNHFDSLLDYLPKPLGAWITNYRNHAFDVGYPDFQVKDSGYADLIHHIKTENCIAFPYLNSMLWDSDHFNDDNALLIDGEYIAYNSTLSHLKYADVSSESWHDVLLESIDNLQTNGVYMDMLSAKPLPIDGDYSKWRKGLRSLLSKCSDYIMAEGNAEVYLDLIDYPLMIVYQDSVPLFDMVYGELIKPVGWKYKEGVDKSGFNKGVVDSQRFGVKTFGSPISCSEHEKFIIDRVI